MTLLQDDRLIRIVTHLGENAFVVLINGEIVDLNL